MRVLSTVLTLVFFGLCGLAGAARAQSAEKPLDLKRPPAALAAWVEKTEEWRPLSPGQLASLASAVGRAEEAGKAARQRLIEHVEATYLADAKGVRAVGREWVRLVDALALPNETRAAWGEKLFAAYAAAPGAFPYAECCAMEGLVARLGSGRARELLAAVHPLP